MGINWYFSAQCVCFYANLGHILGERVCAVPTLKVLNSCTRDKGDVYLAIWCLFLSPIPRRPFPIPDNPPLVRNLFHVALPPLFHARTRESAVPGVLTAPRARTPSSPRIQQSGVSHFAPLFWLHSFVSPTCSFSESYTRSFKATPWQIQPMKIRPL